MRKGYPRPCHIRAYRNAGQMLFRLRRGWRPARGAARPERALDPAVLLLDVLTHDTQRAPPTEPAKYEPDHSLVAR